VIKLSDGGEIVDEIAVADAHPLGARPFGREQYVQKFRTLSEWVLEEAEMERFLDLAQRLPELGPDELGALTLTAAPGALVGVEIPTGLF
jgi:2-methylcitrate dehydratase